MLTEYFCRGALLVVRVLVVLRVGVRFELVARLFDLELVVLARPFELDLDLVERDELRPRERDELRPRELRPLDERPRRAIKPLTSVFFLRFALLMFRAVLLIV